MSRDIVSSSATVFADPAPDFLHRIVTVLEQFSVARSEMGVSELARSTDLNKATTHRIAQGLVTVGLLEQNPVDRRYRLGLRLLGFAAVVHASLDIRERARPVLTRLTEEIGETTYLLIARNGRAVCVERVEGVHMLRDLSTDIGSALLFTQGSAPLAILAHMPAAEIARIVAEEVPADERAAFLDYLDEIRAAGYAAKMDGVQLGHGGIAAPIFEGAGAAVAALSVGGVTARLRENLERYAEAAVDSAAEVSRLIGSPTPNRPSKGE